MIISECMTKNVLCVRQDETADVAARLLSRGNIGAVPVLDRRDRVVGMLTDRDLVLRCMAAGKQPAGVPVGQIMTRGIQTARAEEQVSAVAERMGRSQIRRMPVVRDGSLVGIVSLSDLARSGEAGAARALASISSNISRR
jgi:CBS domain-containing protein